MGNWTLLTRSASLPSEENPVPVKKKKKMNEHTHRHKHIHTNKCKAHTKTPLGTTKLFQVTFSESNIEKGSLLGPQ